MGEAVKTLADQARELGKLVTDAQAKLDQVVRGIESLEGRLADAPPSEQASPGSNASP
jgi:prefoldin subunit 5